MPEQYFKNKLLLKKLHAYILTHKRISFFLAFIFALFILALIWTNPALTERGTVKIWDSHGTLLYEEAGQVGKKRSIRYNEIPQHVIQAVIASEDATFWTNYGVDARALFRSAVNNIKEGRIVSGGSTITQQLARSGVIAPDGVYSRSFIRKIREVIIALRLTLRLSKEEILTRYLNTMYFGNAQYGIQSASQGYFGKDVERLSLAEGAFLIGLLSSPEARNPFTAFEAAKERQEFVLDRMVVLGFITEERASQSKKESIDIISSDTAQIKAPHFIHFIEEQVAQLGIGYSGGINIYTTLDYPLLSIINEIADRTIQSLQERHDVHNAAVVVLDNETGKILSLLGGINYFDATHSGQVNMATAFRQPGSALKPVTYAAGFMKGFTPATVLYDVKKVYKTRSGEGFTPNNYDGIFHGMVLAREALASSLNVPAVEMLEKIGIDTLISQSKAMGITTLTDTNRYDLALTLGGGEVTLLELTNVYATFAREGMLIHPYTIEKITGDHGNVLYEHQTEQSKQTLGDHGKQIAYLISHILSDPKARMMTFGEKNPLILSRQAAVKTGTTTDWHDNWTIGYTPSFTVGVWVGNNDNHPMKDITGVVGAAPIWNQVFEELLKGTRVEQFQKPEEIVQKDICAQSGLLDDGVCPQKLSELFIASTEPKVRSDLHKKVMIDTRNNLLATETCPATFVVEKIVAQYPPEIYSWAVDNHQDVLPAGSSPLCSDKPDMTTRPFIEILNPKEKAEYEFVEGPVMNQNIVFESRVSNSIVGVEWFVNEKHVGTATQSPFSLSWPMKKGTYIITAKGLTGDGNHIISDPVSITIVGYKDGF